jgi:hypothetical protein
MLHPYKGTRRNEHLGPDGRGGHSISSYGEDGPVPKTYSFNSLGFRGEEFDADAPLKLFVCGCSITFGTALDIEESWPFLFRQKLAEQHGLAESSVNLMNFSEGGASNDYITRTLIEQSTQVRPDLIVAGFTHMHRFELLDESTAFRFNPLMLEKYASAGGKFAEMAKLAEFVFLGTDDVQKKMRMIKNVLLLQYFCQSREIPFIFLFLESLLREDLPSALAAPTTQPLFEEIDFDALVPLSPATKVDRASDEVHPGPRSQELIAEAAWKTVHARYGTLAPRALMRE